MAEINNNNAGQDSHQPTETDASLHTGLEQVLETSEAETLVFKDPNAPIEFDINNIPEISESEMNAISNEYVSSILFKIQMEVQNEANSLKQQEQKVKSKKKKKAKKNKEHPETEEQKEVGPKSPSFDKEDNNKN
jgi:hypothetical protein